MPTVNAPGNSLSGVIDAKVRDAVAGASRSLERLSTLLERMKASDEDLRQARLQGKHIGDIFLLVIVGEVKAGKSSFINALVGETVCKEGSIPTTDKVHILRFGEERKERVLDDYLVEQSFPFSQLQAFSIVDTPGTNSLVKQHQAITEDFIPRCDLVLFTTSVDRPFTSTERDFLEFIMGKWKKSVVFVVTKADQKSVSELDEIRNYVRDSAKALLGFDPQIFMVSSKQAREGRERSDPALIRASGFPELEKWLGETLKEGDQASLKLGSVIGSGLQIATRAGEDLTSRLNVLKHDAETSDAIETKLEQAGKDLSEDYQQFVSQLETVIHDVERKAHNWIDDNVVITNFNKIRNREAFRNAFQANVAGSIGQQIDEVLNKASDWFTRRSLKIVDDITEYVDSRREGGLNRAGQVGHVSPKFKYQREDFYNRLRQDARKSQETFDNEGLVRRMSDAISSGLMASFGIAVTGTGAAVLSAVVATSLTAGVVGIVGGILVAALALAMLPIKRSKMKGEISNRCAKLREEIVIALRNQLRTEAEGFVRDLRESMEPFTKGVTGEREKINKWQEELAAIRTELLNLRKAVE